MTLLEKTKKQTKTPKNHTTTTKQKNQPKTSATHSNGSREVMTNTSWGESGQDITLLPLTCLLKPGNVWAPCELYEETAWHWLQPACTLWADLPLVLQTLEGFF